MWRLVAVDWKERKIHSKPADDWHVAVELAKGWIGKHFGHPITAKVLIFGDPANAPSELRARFKKDSSIQTGRFYFPVIYC